MIPWGLLSAACALVSGPISFYTLRVATGAAAAGGLAFINSVGSLGGYVGPWMVGVLKDVTGSFETGTAPILDLQAEHDPVAPRRFAGVLKSLLGDRATIVVIPIASFASRVGAN
jgi:hypothetical protein